LPAVAGFLDVSPEVTMAARPRSAQRNVPDSPLSRDRDEDMAPDDVRRTDRSLLIAPDSLPPAEDETSPDGGVAQHPIHDDDLEDLGPEDFEDEIDEIEEVGGVKSDPA
jgi:hypothetical protein